MATDPRPTLLGAQDRQCAEQVAEEPAFESQAGATGDLDGRDQEGCARGVRCLRRDLGASNTTRRSSAWSKIAMRCWPSTTSRPSIGSIYARAMSLKARLRRFVTAPYVRRDVSRTRPRWP